MVADFKQGTTLTGKILASGQLTATTATTVYTVPASSAVKIASVALTNTTANAVTVTVNVVASGGSAAATNQILTSYALAGYDVLTHKDVLAALDGAFLDAGAFLTVTAATANAVNFFVTGAVSA